MLIPATTHEVYQLEANLCYAFVDPTRILILYAPIAGNVASISSDEQTLTGPVEPGLEPRLTF